MKRVILWISLVLLSSLALLGCQPIRPTEELAMTGTPVATGDAAATDAVTPDVTPEMTLTPEMEATGTPEAEAATTVTPGDTVTATQEITGTQEMTGEQGLIPEVTFIAVEYEFQGPASIAGGWTRIVVENQGELPHDFILARLHEGRTLADVEALLQEESDAQPPEWIDLYGGVGAAPGERGSYLINLPAGDYVYLSFGEAEEGPNDAAQGMTGSLTVTEAEDDGAALSLPDADVTVDMVDYAFVMTGLVQAGEQLIHVSNNGTEPHHMLIFRLQEGATFGDFQTFLQGDGSEGPPPIDFYGGMNDLSPGVEAYLTQEFEAGDYVFICFVSSEEHGGAPHFALGMMQEVTIE